MVFPSLEQAKQLASQGIYGRIPIRRELLCDSITPITALRILKNASHHCFLLESAQAGKNWGRYSFLGFDPSLELSCLNGILQIKGDTVRTLQTDHPGESIRHILAENKAPRLEGMPPFTGGLVGYFAYDYIKYSEPTLTLDAENEEALRDVDIMLFDKIIAFDHFRQKIILLANMCTSQPESEYNKAVAELESLAHLLQNGTPSPDDPLRLHTSFQALLNEEAYCGIVGRAKQYIRKGDIFQVVLSNRLEASCSGSLLDTYRMLRSINPSPYMFYFSSDDMEIAGASPETLIKLENGLLRTFPLAGTRPRGKTPEEQSRLEQELLADEKECAEHDMLVDLGRNDLGRISKIGTVHVEAYKKLERFSHVTHIASTVCGEIRDDCDALDAIDAILPAGTLSGAPKLRACQIIQELERNKRGIYGGAIGYIDFSGNLDTCIAIRLAFTKNGKVYIRSGAGIVADSVPQAEYRECINKAKAVVAAIEKAQEVSGNDCFDR